MYSIYKTNTTIWLYVYVHIRQHSQNSLNYTKSNVSDRIVNNSASRWSVWVSRHELPKHIPPKEPTPRGYVGSRNLDLNSQWPVNVKTNGSCKSWDIFWSFFLGGIKLKIFQLDAEIEFQTWTICLPFFCNHLVDSLSIVAWFYKPVAIHTEASSQNHVHAKSRSSDLWTQAEASTVAQVRSQL